jgi:hypothetical protein
MMMPALMIHSISAVGKFSMLFILLSILIYFIKKSIARNRIRAIDTTWGCGYALQTSKMQYTGKSFSKSLAKLLNFIVLEKKKYKEISGNEIFPAERKYSSHYSDFFKIRVFDGIIDRLLYSLNYFQFIQNGKIQMYILYGVFFIVLVFLGTIFKFF